MNNFNNAGGFITAERVAQLAAVRKANRVAIDLCSGAAGISSGTLWRAEAGLTRLTETQGKKIEDYILRTVTERLKTTISNLNSNVGAGAEAPSLAEEGREKCRQDKHS